jgi:CRP-like cAMP-binding protein
LITFISLQIKKQTTLFQTLKSDIEKLIRLTDKEWEQFENAFTFLQAPKKFQLVKEGEISREIYYIKKGIVRYFYNKDGEEITGFIFTENLFASSYESFLRQTPSIQVLETVEDCELLVINFESLQKLYADVPKINVLTRVIAEQRFLNAQQILSSFILDTPEERYLKFSIRYPEILQRVPQHIIASFLGITPVSLSRIRNRISGK